MVMQALIPNPNDKMSILSSIFITSFQFCPLTLIYHISHNIEWHELLVFSAYDVMGTLEIKTVMVKM